MSTTAPLAAIADTKPLTPSSTSPTPPAIINPSYTPIAHPSTDFSDFASFYPYYLGEHHTRKNRILHLIGTLNVLFGSSRITLGILGRIFRPHVTRKDAWKRMELSNSRLAAWALGTLIQAYTLAWIGHFWLEKNRPATFKYPVFSLRGDFRMFWEVVALKREM